jgi:excisionase family DNA binding protein
MPTARPDLVGLLAQLVQALTEQHPHPAPPHVRPARDLPERVLLTPEEAGESLGIGRTKVYALIKTGELQSVQIGRLRRIPTTAVHKYAARLIANTHATA